MCVCHVPVVSDLMSSPSLNGFRIAKSASGGVNWCTVTIDHDNGVTSRYCGLDGSLEVREGDTVQTGQKIGVTGASPDLESALEPHLHLEVQKSGVYVDPTAYFG